MIARGECGRAVCSLVPSSGYYVSMTLSRLGGEDLLRWSDEAGPKGGLTTCKDGSLFGVGRLGWNLGMGIGLGSLGWIG